MPNNYLSVLNKHIIQVENKNVGLKVGGTNIPLPPPPNQKSGGVAHAPLAPPPPLPTPVYYTAPPLPIYKSQIPPLNPILKYSERLQVLKPVN